MKHINKLFLLLGVIGMISCDKQETIADTDTFRVDFSTGVQTRASSIPAGRTVRIVVYRSYPGATEADFTRKLVAQKTYTVNAGNLTPCTVDAAGISSTGTNGVPVMTLPLFSKSDPGCFDIYAYSPAIPLDPGDTTVTVTNNMDFMATAMIGYQIPSPLSSIANATITIPDLKRFCSAIAFKDIYNDGGIIMAKVTGFNTTLNRYQGLFIDDLCTKGTYKLATDSIAVDRNGGISTVYLLPKATDNYTTTTALLNNPYINGVLDKTRLGTCNTTSPNSAYVNDLYVLPGAVNNPVAKNKFSFRIDIRFSNTANQNSTGALITPPLDGSVFLKGNRIEYSIKVNYNGTYSVLPAGVVTVTTGPIIDWQAGGETDKTI